jgi:alpha 1,2-mannosyltransferase
MRLTIHRLVLLSLLSFGLLLFYLIVLRSTFDSSAFSLPFLPSIVPNSKPASLRPPLESVNADVNATHLNAVRRFWSPWAKVIRDAKPDVPAIDLHGAVAGEISAEGSTDTVRQPLRDMLGLSGEAIEGLKGAHDKMRAALNEHSMSLDQEADSLFKGRGVVIGGGGEYFGPALVGIKMLRQTGSNIPVEVFLANWEEYEPTLCEKVLPDLNAKCMVLTQFLEPQNTDEVDEGAGDRMDLGFSITHYQLKSLALLFTRFQEVLLLDSDSIPLVNPDELFWTEPFVFTGLIGWPDFWIGTESPVFYEIAGLGGFPKNLPLTSSEAGQLLVDKRKHVKTLLLATYYNVWGPDYYYPLLSQGALGPGAKNTFETAAVVLGARYYRVKTPVRSMGRHTTHGGYRGSGMVQFHPADDNADSAQATGPSGKSKMRPAFMHANTPKMNAGHLVDEGDLQDEISKQHLRLWGSLEDQQAVFGMDMEKRTFQVVVDVGCELANVVKEWKHREEICTRLKTHFKATFE